MASTRITGGDLQAAGLDPSTTAQRIKDLEGRYEHPLAICLAAADADTSFMDVFPASGSTAKPHKVNLPDFDIAVGVDWAVNGAQCPVVIFGSADGQRLTVPRKVRDESPSLKSDYQLVSQHFRIKMLGGERTSLHSRMTETQPWASLIRDTIMRVERDHWSHTQGFRAMRRMVIEDFHSHSQEGDVEDLTGHALTPLLELHDGRVVAALAETEEGHPLLLLPSWTPNKRAWLLAAWAFWVEDGSMRSPAPKSGYEDEAWMTAAELELHATIMAKRAELNSVRDRLEAEIAELTDQLVQAGASAAQGFRRLLTEQDDPLVESVQEALQLLGFGVQDMDEVFDEKREDLRATEPERQWTALVEVKGYAKGGKASDFTKFIRYTRLYMRDEKKTPDACWYVINSYRDQAPAARPGPFESARDAVDRFKEDADGLVIPTTELHKLVRDVQLGVRGPEDARAALVGKSGIFRYEPVSEGSSP